MKPQTPLTALFLMLSIIVSGQNDTIGNDVAHSNDAPNYRFWQTSGIVLGLNAANWTYARFAVNADYAHINFASVKRNFTLGWTWDNDNLATNLFSHPYAGAMYYNAARSNGYGYLTCAAFTAFGSLNWEMFFETERPSINDFFATTAGGIALGEALHRISELLVDNGAVGFKRLIREAGIFVIAPTKGFNRIISGMAWAHGAGSNLDKPILQFNIATGIRNVFYVEEFPKNIISYAADFWLEYGESTNADDVAPYEYFVLEAGIDVPHNAPEFNINRINLRARLWGRDLLDAHYDYLNVGFYQNFFYYDSEKQSPQSQRNPYRFGTPASFGFGFMHDNRRYAALLRTHLYVNGFVMGAALSDHYHYQSRNYNLGDGVSVHYRTALHYRRWTAALRSENYFLFTMAGYPADYDFVQADPNDMFFQGDRSRTYINAATLHLNYQCTARLFVALENSFYNRFTHYRHFPDVKTTAVEAKLMLGWRI